MKQDVCDTIRHYQRHSGAAEDPLQVVLTVEVACGNIVTPWD